jgi:FAD-linked oxidoreductase
MPRSGTRYAHWRNWAGNFVCQPQVRHRPSSVAEVAAIVRQARQEGRSVRPVGSGYSYTRLVQTDDVMLSLDRFAGVETIDDAGVATVRAGTVLGPLVRELAARGGALQNLGDIDKQTVAGAIATSTHGTGITLGTISTRITGVELVTADGEVRWIGPEDGNLLRAAAVSLGVLGIVTRVKLQTEPLYWLHIERKRITFDGALEDLDANVRNNRNYEFFWFPRSDLVYSKTMNESAQRTGGGRTLGRWVNDIVNENAAMWAVCHVNRRFPSMRQRLLDLGANLVPQDRSVQRADNAYATERLVVHQECEYAVPAARAVETLVRLNDRLHRFPTRTLFPIEVRFTRADDLLLSPAYGRDVAYIAVHTWWKEDHEEYFDAAEDIFRAAGGRPHWGKMHTLNGADLAALYPKSADFGAIRRRLDPTGLFLNGYLKRILRPSLIPDP